MSKQDLHHFAVSANIPFSLSNSSSKSTKKRIRKRIVTKLSSDGEDSSFSSYDLEDSDNELQELEQLRAENSLLRQENIRLMHELDHGNILSDGKSWHDDGIVNSLTSVISSKPETRDGANATGARHRRTGPSTSRYDAVLHQEPETDSGSLSKSKKALKYPNIHKEGGGIENCKNGDNENITQSFRRDEESNSDDINNLEVDQAMSNASISNLLETESFRALFLDRAAWLVGLLILQSISGFILQSNEDMLQEHLPIVNFLTMLVGAGGNAGNQASVQAIRGLAIGWLNPRTIHAFLRREAKMALYLAVTLGLTGFIRAALFKTESAETVAITCSLVSIVLISVTLGSLLPLGMIKCRIDPAHSSTTIQVIMDILGVSITCWVSSYILKIQPLKGEAL